MTSTNLQRCDGENGVELFIDRKDGSVYASIRGYARMAGKGKSTINERLQGVRFDEVKTVKVQTTSGLQGVRLIPESLIQKWIIRDNPTLAEQMMAAGCRVYLYGQAGYEVKPQPKPKKKSKWKVARAQGKRDRRALTDAVKWYLETHPELPDNARKFMYSNVSNKLNRALFGHNAKYLYSLAGCKRDDFRDNLTESQLIAIDMVELVASEWVYRGVTPMDATAKAIAATDIAGRFLNLSVPLEDGQRPQLPES